ncbi:sarcosine oxidase subunit delta [Ruegeria arenilitoris]|uniref:sarcosine oxidase subunit delta n=1 Tax=Ruegeria arenilitoris TaxID=1173585 RepID=UPI00147B639C|nr:sarcosine oxidase subunit delta [Ruegeria arenilitoris]
MRISCPFCGERDRREFYYRGAAVDLERPLPGAGADVWDAFVYLRENPAGETRELWYHEGGCGAWIVVTRNTVTHEILRTEHASEARS